MAYDDDPVRLHAHFNGLPLIISLVINCVGENLFNRSKRINIEACGLCHTDHLYYLFLKNAVFDIYQRFAQMMVQWTFESLFSDRVPAFVRKLYNINLSIRKKQTGCRLKNIRPTFLGFSYIRAEC